VLKNTHLKSDFQHCFDIYLFSNLNFPEHFNVSVFCAFVKGVIFVKEIGGTINRVFSVTEICLNK
jgi:hypothetical protein